MSKKTTKNKGLVVGKTQYINSKTGELEDFNVIQQNDVDFNFNKIWLSYLLDALDVLGNKKIAVMNYLLANKDSKNMIIATQRKIAEEAKVSLPVVTETLKLLQEKKVLKLVQNGVYAINPNVIFKGKNKQRMNILLQYNTIEEFDEKPENKGVEDNSNKENDD